MANKGSRPASAFTSDRIRVREELIKNSFLTGKLSSHIGPYGDASKREKGTLVAIGEKPKKKTFEEILREAEEKVVR